MAPTISSKKDIPMDDLQEGSAKQEDSEMTQGNDYDEDILSVRYPSE